MKINKKTLVLALVIAAGIAAIPTTKVRASADTQLLSLMPPYSQILLGARVDQGVVSPVGQYILGQIGGNLDDVKTKTGFDPRTDLREVIVAPVAKLIAARGTFPISRLEDLLQQGNHTVDYYQGFKTLGDAKQSVTFLDGSTLVVGEPNAVHQAIDRWNAHAQPPANDMTAKVAEVSATSQGWLAVANVAALQNLIGQPQQQNPQSAIVANVLQKVTAVSGQFTLPPSGGVSMQGQVLAASAQDAQTLVDAYQGLKLLAPPAAANNPLLNPQVTVNGSTINFSESLTQQQVETLAH